MVGREGVLMSRAFRLALLVSLLVLPACAEQEEQVQPRHQQENEVSTASPSPTQAPVWEESSVTPTVEPVQEDAPTATPMAEPAPDPTDRDGDGWPNVADGAHLLDCDDDSATVHPGAPEVCSNGVDDDCNGVQVDGNPHDYDGDGFLGCSNSPAATGVDCNDGSPLMFPGSTYPFEAGLDGDCDGLVD